MPIAGTGFGRDQHLAAAEVTVLGVERVGQNSQLLNGIQIGDYRGAHVEVLLRRAAVDIKPVAGLALPVDGQVAGIEIAGRRRAGAAGHDDGVGLLRAGGNHARLERQHVGVAAAGNRHGSSRGRGDRFSHLHLGCINA